MSSNVRIEKYKMIELNDDTQNIACFLCDDIFTKDKKSWNIFSKIYLKDSQLTTSLSDILSSALGCEIDEESAHSTILCNKCKNLTLKYKNTEQKLNELRNDIVTAYTHTIEVCSLTPIRINMEISSVDNFVNYDYLDSEDEAKILPKKEMLHEESPNRNIDKSIEKNISSMKTSFDIFKEHDPLSDSSASIQSFPEIKKEININIEEEDNNSLKDEISSENQTLQKTTNEKIIANQKLINKSTDLSSGPLQCDICNKTFLQIKKFKKHKYAHAAQARKAKCNSCHKIFTARHLKKHKLRCTNGDSDEDNIEDQNELDAANNKNPVDNVEYDNNTLKNVYKCPVCEKLFATKLTLHHHIENHKRNENENENETETDPLKDNENVYNQVNDSTTGAETIYKCDKCGKILATWEALRYHKGIHSEILFECDICKVNFTHKRNLRKHKLFHIKERQPTFECDICKKKFFNKTSLDQHAQVHNSQTYKCDDCGKVYAQLRNLKEHQKRKREGKRFACKFCNKLFTFKVPMKEHEGTHVHSSKYEFKCETCSKKFYTNTELKRHIVVHTSSLDFECDICHRKFFMKTVLNHHKNVVHMGIKNYLCDICGKAFAYPGTLQSHYAVHNSECLLQCQYCTKRFTSKQRLSIHNYKIHKIRNNSKSEIKATNIENINKNDKAKQVNKNRR